MVVEEADDAGLTRRGMTTCLTQSPEAAVSLAPHTDTFSEGEANAWGNRLYRLKRRRSSPGGQEEQAFREEKLSWGAINSGAVSICRINDGVYVDAGIVIGRVRSPMSPIPCVLYRVHDSSSSDTAPVTSLLVGSVLFDVKTCAMTHIYIGRAFSFFSGSTRMGSPKLHPINTRLGENNVSPARHTQQGTHGVRYVRVD